MLTFVVATALSVATEAPPADRIHLGKGRFGSRADALEAGLFEYQGRWLPARMRSKLEAWEKQDRRSATWADRYETRSKSYRIETNVPRFIIELEIKPFLDELYESYVRVYKQEYGLKGKGANGKLVRIYHGFEEYHRHEGEPRGTPAFYLDGTLVSYYDDHDPAEFYNSIFHEGAHQFFAALLPGASLPTWLDEAIATWFEAGVYSRARQTIDLTGLPRDRVLSAKEMLAKAGDAVDLGALFLDVPYESFEAEHYALAWSFVHYLVHREGGRRKKAFAKFLKEMNGAGVRPVGEVFKKATRENLRDLAGPWRDYVLAMEPGEGLYHVHVEVSEASGAEDVESGDRVDAIDGIGVHSEEQLERLWDARPTDRPFELALIREREVPEPIDFVTERVVVTIEPGSKLTLAPAASSPRSHSLIDW